MAHAGALLGLGCAGFSVEVAAGTSAGAIIATLVAAFTATADDKASAENFVLDCLSAMPARRFMDGSSASRDLINATTRKIGTSDLPRLLAPSIRVISYLLRGKPLYTGDSFSKWMDRILSERGFSTFHDLSTSLDGRLKVVVTALPFGIKLILPDHADIFETPLTTLRPSFMTRASMSIPFVYRPIIMPLSRSGWAEHCDRHLVNSFPKSQIQAIKSLRQLTMVDGGILSNVPIDLFSQNTKNLPVFALRLYNNKGMIQKVYRQESAPRPLNLISSLFNAARGIRDREAIDIAVRERSVRNIWIDTESASWLDFSGRRSVALHLIRRGLSAVHDLRNNNDH